MTDNKTSPPGQPPVPVNARPAGWRPEWRVPRQRAERKSAPPRVRARGDADRVDLAVAAEPLPPPEKLRDEALRAMRGIGRDPNASSVARVAAWRSILEATRPGAVSTLEDMTDEEIDCRRRELVAQILASLPAPAPAPRSEGGE